MKPIPSGEHRDPPAAPAAEAVRWWPARVGLNLLLALGGVAAALGLAEVAVRLAPRAWVPELGTFEQQQFHLGGLARLSANPRLYYELIPDNPDVEVNTGGYRGPLYPERKPAGVRRVVGIGDSTMFGWSVPEGQGFLRQLERLLNRSDAAPVEVVNLAVPGYNSLQELELLRTRGLRFEPDLVILAYDHNDPKPVVGQPERDPPLPADLGRNTLGSELLRLVARRLWVVGLARVDASPEHNTYVERYDTTGYVAGGPLWDSHLEALAELARLTRERGVPVVVVIYDAFIPRERGRRRRPHYRELHRRLAPFWTAHGFHAVDCYDLFQGHMRAHGLRDSSSLWVTPRDGHPNANAHTMIATAVFETIERLRLLR